MRDFDWFGFFVSVAVGSGAAVVVVVAKMLLTSPPTPPPPPTTVTLTGAGFPITIECKDAGEMLDSMLFNGAKVDEVPL